MELGSGCHRSKRFEAAYRRPNLFLDRWTLLPRLVFYRAWKNIPHSVTNCAFFRRREAQFVIVGIITMET
jgi:hypothetical protein